MSKSKVPELSWGNGWVSDSEIQNRIVGRILGIIELIGLTEKQEESAKDLIRKAVWDSFEDSVFISSKAHTEIKNWGLAFKSDSDKRGVPYGEIDFTICPE